MKKSMFKSSLRCAALMLAALAFASCAEENLGPEVTPTDEPEQTETKITTVALATIAGDASRVTYAAATRADEQTGETGEAESDELKPGDLRLIATIANPSKKEVFGFAPEDTPDGRWLSATSVFYNPNDQTYYATYHIQGNNYNTELETDVAGAIQMFKVDETGEVTLDDYFRAAKPAEEDYDFNHIYFDNTDQRIIVVGHKQNPAATEKGGNTRAIIGTFDPTAKTLKYAPINTAEKAYDADGKSLGYKDAGDANCVVRVMDYPYYYVATRKGIAALCADAENLFKPVLNEDGSNYFVPTPGSAKFVYDTPRDGSMMDFLYLAEEHTGDVAYTTSSKARIAQFQTTPGTTGAYVLMNPAEPHVTYYDSKDLDILQYEKQFELPEVITPIDGKNTIQVLEDYEYYAALGTSGLYYTFRGAINSNKTYEGVLKFGNRPVNNVFVEKNEDNEGLGTGYDRTSHDGFIYVANGSKLTILHRRTLEEVASWNMPSTDKEDNAIASSANYITVVKMPAKEQDGLCERIVTVAFGQEGLRVFRFLPETKTVFEH